MLMDENNRRCNSKSIDNVFHEISLSFAHTIDLIEDIVSYRCYRMYKVAAIKKFDRMDVWEH